MTWRRVAAGIASVVLLAAGAVTVAIRLAGEAPAPPAPTTAPRPTAAPVAELLVVLEPPPDGSQLVRVERAEPGTTLDGGDRERRVRFVRSDPPEVVDVSWDPGQGSRPSPPPGFLAVPDLAPGARSLVLSLDSGVTVSAWPEIVDADGVQRLAVAEGRTRSESTPLGLVPSARSVRALTGWFLDGRLLVPFDTGVVAVERPGAAPAELVDLARRLQPVDDESFRRWTSSFARSGSPTRTRLVASGTSSAGDAWRVRTEERDGLGTARVRLGDRDHALVAPGDAVRWPGGFVALVSTAGRVRSTVDDRPVPVRIIPVAGRAVLVLDTLPIAGRLELVTPLQTWTIDLATPDALTTKAGPLGRP